VIELSRDPADGDRWVLDGVGTLRRTGRVSRAATAEAGGARWQIVRRGWVRSGFAATDASTGAVVGELAGRFLKRGETLRWADRDLALRGDGGDGYVLLDGQRRLAVMTPQRAGRRSLDVVVEDPTVDPGLLLFMAFVVQAYSDDASFPTPTPD
jgi:hypothetical protein